MTEQAQIIGARRMTKTIARGGSWQHVLRQMWMNTEDPRQHLVFMGALGVVLDAHQRSLGRLLPPGNEAESFLNFARVEMATALSNGLRTGALPRLVLSASDVADGTKRAL